MKYKAVISDLDGTLLGTDHRVSEETKKVIEKVISMGIKFYIATGRHHMDVFQIKNKIGLEAKTITSNGACIHDENNNIVSKTNIKQEISNKILERNYHEHLQSNAYVGDEWFAGAHLPEANDYHGDSKFSYNLVDFKSLRNKEITKFFFIHEDTDVIQRVKRDLEENFSDHVSITLSLPECLEVMEKGITKGVAITDVLEKEGIKLEETIAFGDGMNDLEMLGLVGKGCIMENGAVDLKAALPHLEVIKSNWENGVAEKLKEIFQL